MVQASVQMVSGKAEVFGYQLGENTRILVREKGKRLPFFVNEKAIFDVSLGATATIQEVAGSTVPSSWSKPVDAVLSVPNKPVVLFWFWEKLILEKAVSALFWLTS